MIFHSMVFAMLVLGYTSKEMKPPIPHEIVAAAMLNDFKVPEVKERVVESKPVPVPAPERPKIEKIKEVPPEIVVHKMNKALELEKKLEQIKIAKREKEKLAQVKQQEAKLAQALREQEKRDQYAKLEQNKQEQARLKEEQLALMQAQQQEREKANQAQFLKTIDRYALLMRAKIHQNWRRPLGIDNIYKCKVAVKLRSNGEVISAIVINSSGNVEFDRSAELAIRKSSPLPLPAEDNMKAPFNDFTFTFDPETA